MHSDCFPPHRLADDVALESAAPTSNQFLKENKGGKKEEILMTSPSAQTNWELAALAGVFLLWPACDGEQPVFREGRLKFGITWH